jgi:hypothetical protein
MGNSWVAAQLAASQEGLSSMREWVRVPLFIKYEAPFVSITKVFEPILHESTKITWNMWQRKEVPWMLGTAYGASPFCLLIISPSLPSGLCQPSKGAGEGYHVLPRTDHSCKDNGMTAAGQCWGKRCGKVNPWAYFAWSYILKVNKYSRRFFPPL